MTCADCGTQGQLDPSFPGYHTCAACGGTFPAPPIERGVLRAETIVGWRLWRIGRVDQVMMSAAEIAHYAALVDAGENPLRDMTGWRLSGVGLPSLWLQPTIKAACSPPGRPQIVIPGHSQPAPVHEAPAIGCGCGVWAVTAGALQRALDQYVTLAGAGPYAIGQVQLWGRYVRHEHGWRAQYARPYDVTVVARPGGESGDVERIASDLRRFYRCDVSVTSELPFGLEPPKPRATVTINFAAHSAGFQRSMLLFQKQLMAALTPTLESFRRGLDAAAREAVVNTTTGFTAWSRDVAGPHDRRRR